MKQDGNIRLYMFLRLALLYSVLISLVLYQSAGILAPETIVKTYFVTFFTFLVTSAFTFLHEKARNVSYFLASQIVYDILFTTALIFYTGPFDSMFTVFYVFNILFASLLLDRAGALLAAIASAMLYAAIASINSDKINDEKSFSMLTTITGFVSLSLLAGQLVDELRKSRQRISRLEDLSMEIVDSLDSGLLGIDSAGLVRKINRSARGMLGMDAAESMLGKPVREVLPALGEVSAKGEVRELSIRGGMRRILVSRVDLPEAHAMILLRDLTEVLDLEERVRRQERLASVGRLATGVAHEIRNPIASISGAAQILSSQSSDQEEYGRLTQLIVRESERVDRLVSQLLRFARPSIAKRDPVDVDAVVRECIEGLAARSDFKELGIEIVSSIDDALVIHGNRDDISEVVANLLVNAMQALAEEKSGRMRRIKVSSHRMEHFVEVVVEDNGPGIPRDFRERVFDPFFTTKPAGTGLGLAQVHKIIREHDGQVDLQTEEGRGTALKIRLPA